MQRSTHSNGNVGFSGDAVSFGVNKKRTELTKKEKSKLDPMKASGILINCTRPIQDLQAIIQMVGVL